MTAHELPGPVKGGAGPGFHYFATEMPLDIGDHGGDRRISIVGVLLDGLQNDAVQVPLEPSPELGGRESSSLRRLRLDQ